MVKKYGYVLFIVREPLSARLQAHIVTIELFNNARRRKKRQVAGPWNILND